MVRVKINSKMSWSFKVNKSTRRTVPERSSLLVSCWPPVVTSSHLMQIWWCWFSGGNTIYYDLMYTKSERKRQREQDELPARPLVSPAAVWFSLLALSVCLQLSACPSSEHHMANSVFAQEHHTWKHNIHTIYITCRNTALIAKQHCRNSTNVTWLIQLTRVLIAK